MSEDQSAIVTLKVRVTPEFREKITEVAKANNRSMNQEIVSRLESSFSEKELSNDFFKKNLHLFLSAYCAGLESNYEEAIHQLNEKLKNTSIPSDIQELKYRIHVNNILKSEMHRLMESNSKKVNETLIEGVNSMPKAP